MALGSTNKLTTALNHLSETIDDRAINPSADSYTAKLLADGANKCAKKLGEEGVELALAIASESGQDVADEAADLLYHMFVGLRSRDVSLEQVANALIKRQGMSGLEEKASRNS